MPRVLTSLTRAQLVMVELAAAVLAGGLAESKSWTGGWTIAGAVVAFVLAVLALLPVRRRWLYQIVLARLGLATRRRRMSHSVGLAGVLGDYEVLSVPGGNHGGPIGAVRSGTTWCVPLMLGLDDVLNEDQPVPLSTLAGLLQVEDVPLASVRLLMLTAPAQVSNRVPAGPVAPLTPLAARYVLLTLDTRLATAAIAARGGTEAAVEQILRRCAIHARQELATANVSAQRVNPEAAASLFTTWMGPASPQASRQGDRATESWRDVRVSGTWSTMFAVSGDGPDVVDRAIKLVSAAPTPVAVTTLLLQRGGRSQAVETTVLVRLSTPETMSREGVAESIEPLAQAYGLRLQRLDGEQGDLLRATAPVGVEEVV